MRSRTIDQVPFAYKDIDQVPFLYKDINQIMASQNDLVEPVARFFPRLVKMPAAGERPEDEPSSIIFKAPFKPVHLT